MHRWIPMEMFGNTNNKQIVKFEINNKIVFN